MAEPKRNGGSRAIPAERLQRAARLYHTDVDAARALGLSKSQAFKKACVREGVETPNMRKERQQKERTSR